jgi:hypothetical protein
METITIAEMPKTEQAMKLISQGYVIVGGYVAVNKKNEAQFAWKRKRLGTSLSHIFEINAAGNGFEIKKVVG